jgi:hypothetical protein
MLCVICGIGGYELRSSTDSATSPLPIAKGGTGAKSAADARTNLGMTTSVSGSSTNNEFPSSKATYDFANKFEVWSNDYAVAVKYTNLGLVFVRFFPKSNITNGTKLGNLPENYRPRDNVATLAPNANNNAFGKLQIRTDGDLYFWSATTLFTYESVATSYSTK